MPINLEVKTKTTGFGSPAESWVENRLDLNQLIVEDIYTTFYFKWGGDDNYGVKKNDVLVVDRSVLPNKGDLILVEREDSIKLEIFDNQNKPIWGTITWILSQIKR